MTALIYRGAPHFKTETTIARTPQALVYRGVRHDGMPRPSERTQAASEMCYRGIAYTLAAGGHRVVEAATAQVAMPAAAAMG